MQNKIYITSIKQISAQQPLSEDWFDKPIKEAHFKPFEKNNISQKHYHRLRHRQIQRNEPPNLLPETPAADWSIEAPKKPNTKIKKIKNIIRNIILLLILFLIFYLWIISNK